MVLLMDITKLLIPLTSHMQWYDHQIVRDLIKLAEFESHVLERSWKQFKVSSVPPNCDASKIFKFLIPLVPSGKMATKNKKSSGLVMTNEDSIRKMQKQEQKKQKQSEQNEEKKQLNKFKGRSVKKPLRTKLTVEKNVFKCV